MLAFILRRLGTMLITMLCLTMVVFFMVNLEPNLKKLAISQLDMRTPADQLESWLVKNGYRQNFFVRYGQWIGVVKKQPNIDPATGMATPRFSYLQRACRTLLRRDPAGRFRLLDQIQDDSRGEALAGAWRHRHPDVLGDGHDGAHRAAGRHPRRHARGIANRPHAVGRLDRHNGDAGIRFGHHFHCHFRIVARLAEWLRGFGNRAGHHFLQFHAAGHDHGGLRHRLHRPHDARLDGRGDDAAIHPHRAAEGPELLGRWSSSMRCATR